MLWLSIGDAGLNTKPCCPIYWNKGLSGPICVTQGHTLISVIVFTVPSWLFQWPSGWPICGIQWLAYKNVVQYNMALHTALPWLKYYKNQSFMFTKGTPYHTLMGKLWDVFCDNFLENLILYNITGIRHQITVWCDVVMPGNDHFMETIGCEIGLQGWNEILICIESKCT